MHGIAREFSDALNREITYSERPAEDWERELKRLGLPEHLTRHVVTMGELHRAGRYDRLADGVQRVTGRPRDERPGICVASCGLWSRTQGNTH